MSRAKVKQSVPDVTRRDLVILAADQNTKQSVEELLSSRTHSLGIRTVRFDMIVHPQHDPGCFGQSAGILASYHRTHHHALVIFDREGCGRDRDPREKLEAKVEADLLLQWGPRAAVIVNDPELESWAWSTSPQLPNILGWSRPQSLHDWLVERGFLERAAQVKPDRPKEALDAVLREVRRPRSSAVFRAIAQKVSFEKCLDPAFIKLKESLRNWFPISN